MFTKTEEENIGAIEKRLKRITEGISKSNAKMRNYKKKEIKSPGFNMNERGYKSTENGTQNLPHGTR